MPAPPKAPAPKRDDLGARYLALHQRMSAVVDAYTRADRASEADYVMIDFFSCFEDVEELARHVEIAEESAKEQGVL